MIISQKCAYYGKAEKTGEREREKEREGGGGAKDDNRDKHKTKNTILRGMPIDRSQVYRQ